MGAAWLALVSLAMLANCFDAALLMGFRFRDTPHVSPGIRPFAHVLLGGYWKGSGVDEEQFISEHFALHGGGPEIRWSESIHGLRVSVDVRRVFGGELARNQIRWVFAYVIGPRRFKSPSG